MNEEMNYNGGTNKKKGNVIIVCLTMIILALIGSATVVLLNNNNKDTKKDDKTNKEPKQEENTKKEETKEKKLLNYTKYSDNTRGEEYEIIDGKLTIKYKGKEINVKGIESTAKKFIVTHDFCTSTKVWVLNDEGELFLTTGSNPNEYEEFEKINLSNNSTKISNITLLPYIQSSVSCPNDVDKVGIVLSNGVIKMLSYEDESEQYYLGNLDYTDVALEYSSEKAKNMILYEDGTISKIYYNGMKNKEIEDISKAKEFPKKIQYNNQNIIVNKIYDTGKGINEIVYVVSDNKLYKLAFNDVNGNKQDVKVTLVNNTNIKSESLVMNKGYNDYEKTKKSNVITFEDGKSITISNLDSGYSFK